MHPILLHLLPATLYSVLGLLFWRTCVMRQMSAPTRDCMSRRERILLLCALLAHGAALHVSLFPEAEMHFDIGVALSLMVWLAICFYWVETLQTRLDGLHAVVLPAGVIASLLPALFPGEHILTNATSPAFRAHSIVAMLAYSLFTLAALHAMLMAVAERQLHHARFSRVLANLPPLLTMEALLFGLIGIAFILHTLTLLQPVRVAAIRNDAGRYRIQPCNSVAIETIERIALALEERIILWWHIKAPGQDLIHLKAQVGHAMRLCRTNMPLSLPRRTVRPAAGKLD